MSVNQDMLLSQYFSTSLLFLPNNASRENIFGKDKFRIYVNSHNRSWQKGKEETNSPEVGVLWYSGQRFKTKKNDSCFMHIFSSFV